MNLSTEGFSKNKDVKFNFPNKVTSLNPNAAEFIPSAFRSPYTNTNSSHVSKLDIPGSSTKSVLDRSESSISNKSDDEVHRFWRDQLPDDITPDFTSMGEDELHTPGQLSLSTLSLNDSVETSGFLASGNSSLIGRQQDISPRDVGTFNLGENVGFLGSTYVEDQASNGFMTLSGTEWDKRYLDGANMFTNGREEHHYDVDFNAGLMSDSLNEHAMFEDAVMNPLEFLASQFPGFAAESLADVYYANNCDLNLTIEMLTQLELQDVNFSQNTNAKSSDEPNFSLLDFPALPAAENNNGMSKFNGQDLQQSSNTYRSPSSIPRSTIDFASTVRKLASQDSANRKYERSVSTNGSVGSSRSSQLSSISFNHNGKSAYGDKLRSSSTVRTAPVWLETGEAVANMYSELRGDARDFARLRNACFEQARQAYLIGNGALARELSRKGQLYNMQMKAAHGKARETIYRQRNPNAQDGRMQDRLIDLHGLHVNEAIQVLEHELRILRSSARSAGQRLQVMICVGTGHHTKGTRTPVRLPIAVEHFLLEEGLSFTQPRPGLIRVVIY